MMKFFKQGGRNSLLLLFLVIFTAGLLRFYQLESNPPSLTWDEVAWGYNAYSLGIDGRDEFGRFLPFNYLESFGDYKPPVYAYLDILPVKLLGLNEFSTRFPSALLGTLTVLVSYFLVKRIFYKFHWANAYALLTALTLAISPWHIMLSRAAFEANVATFFLIVGVYLFLAGVQKNSWILSLSAISFVASMYTFNTARIVAPLLVVLLATGYWRRLFAFRKQAFFAGVVGLVILLPAVKFLFSDQARLRFKEVNIFSDISVIKQTNQEIKNDNNTLFAKIVHNRRLAYGGEFLIHYFDNLSSEFLFIKGDNNPKFSTRSVGEMYLYELPFLIAGILFLFKKREGNWWIIPLWLLLGIIPAATARETPHALRIEATLPTFQIIVAYGLINSIAGLKGLIFSIPVKKLLLSLIVIAGLFNVVYFLEDYFIHYPKEFAGEWQYGYKDAIMYAAANEKQYNKIYLTKELGRPYIYTLFYKRYDPKLFRKQAEITRNEFGFVKVKSFGKYYFDPDLVKDEKHVLYIVTPADVRKDSKIQKTFYLPNGHVAVIAYMLD